MTLKEIAKEFEREYRGHQGIYMTRLNINNELVAHVESDENLTLPKAYMGVPVKVLVAPMMKTF